MERALRAAGSLARLVRRCGTYTQQHPTSGPCVYVQATTRIQYYAINYAKGIVFL